MKSYQDIVSILNTTARAELKEGLSLCTEEQQLLFKRMYAGGKLDKNINSVVDSMPTEKLDWAMQQVEATLKKKRKEQ